MAWLQLRISSAHPEFVEEILLGNGAVGVSFIDGEDRPISQGDLVYIPPDKVHSLRPISDHAPIHCFCFAIGVKGAGAINYTTH